MFMVAIHATRSRRLRLRNGHLSGLNVEDISAERAVRGLFLCRAIFVVVGAWVPVIVVSFQVVLVGLKSGHGKITRVPSRLIRRTALSLSRQVGRGIARISPQPIDCHRSTSASVAYPSVPKATLGSLHRYIEGRGDLDL